jgi:hypothetical protein
MPFCYSPWTNIDISPMGALSPCCKFQTDSSSKLNIAANSIKEYQDSEFLQEIKQDFLHNKWPQGCERCRIEEENHIPSKRQLDYERWKDHYSIYDIDKPNFITGSVAFGNSCNLKCITCNPYASSQWRREYEHIYHIDIKPFVFYKKDFVTDLVQSAPDLIHIDIPGGEPFISGLKEQKQLLRHYIDRGQACKMSLHYTTNATVYPEQDWWELWKHFKEIDLQISIDGIEQQYEYLRYPAEWNTVLSHLFKYVDAQLRLENFRLSVSHTVSAYNIFYLDKFITWCHNTGLPQPWLGRVHSPAHMRPTVWPDEAKQKIVTHLNNSVNQQAKDWSNLISNQDDSDLFGKFRSALHQHDQYRNLNFKSVFPELAEYI